MKKVVVYGRSVKVRKQKKLIDDYGAAGFYDPETKTIVIDSSLAGQEFLSTLIHEMVHALFDRAGLLQARIDESAQEIIAEQISTVILENFKLTKK